MRSAAPLKPIRITTRGRLVRQASRLSSAELRHSPTGGTPVVPVSRIGSHAARRLTPTNAAHGHELFLRSITMSHHKHEHGQALSHPGHQTATEALAYKLWQ